MTIGLFLPLLFLYFLYVPSSDFLFFLFYRYLHRHYHLHRLLLPGFYLFWTLPWHRIVLNNKISSYHYPLSKKKALFMIVPGF
jgi:hypothetical protein